MRIIRPTSLIFYLLIGGITGLALAVIGAQATSMGGWLGLAPPAIAAWIALRKPLRRWRAARRPFPTAWRSWLETNVPLYARLDREGRARFERDVRFILDEWIFEGVRGAEVTDILRLGVGAAAAMMLHGRPDWELPARHTVLFYSGSFDEDYLEREDAGFDGMAHAQGPVILSVQAFEHSWAEPFDGSNVVLHELAHLLDYQHSFADGVPSLVDPASTAAWERLVRREMRVAMLGKSLLRRYAASNPAEFFAVAVENFFERPDALRARHPALYDAMTAFFNLYPAEAGD